MKNYFKTKLTTTDRILLGPNIWTFSADQGETLTARTVLKSCSEWTQFSAIFGSMKITGILLETFPNYVGTVDIQNSVVMQGTYVIAYRPALAPSNFNALTDSKVLYLSIQFKGNISMLDGYGLDVRIIDTFKNPSKN